ncbi:MAG: mercury methylation corrinoid protein HgcA [Methanosarcinaceae archaeon]|nr:mercury methylation corrinoid protein HgcA [Methanosarcinaceae archaeon]
MSILPKKEDSNCGTSCCGPAPMVLDLNTESLSKQKDIKIATSEITAANRLDHLFARLGIKRSEHRVEPGLYALGKPTRNSPVFVSANYTLSFDALRSSLVGIDGYILVLDTKGVNVWCAAGKGTFGTDELVFRIEVTGLADVVDHRVLIVPQLGATGVTAHKVKSRTGFKVEYGPVRASDLPEYMKDRRATDEMRRVRFTLLDRMVLAPVELLLMPKILLVVILGISLIGGVMGVFSAIVAILAGTILFPMLLPLLPTKDFSTKGFILGFLVILPFSWNAFMATDTIWWLHKGLALSFLLIMPPITAFFALNFTGASTFTSVVGVKKEIYRYVPIMALMFVIGVLLMIVLRLISITGGGSYV